MHDTILKLPEPSPECCLPFIAQFDSEKIVCPTEVNFGKDFNGTKLLKKARDQGKRVLQMDVELKTT